MNAFVAEFLFSKLGNTAVSIHDDRMQARRTFLLKSWLRIHTGQGQYPSQGTVQYRSRYIASHCLYTTKHAPLKIACLQSLTEVPSPESLRVAFSKRIKHVLP
jgi:hypothetical protein